MTLAAALTGTGTLDQGFDEVVIYPPLTRDYVHQTGWPHPSLPEVDGYPLYPHQLTLGDRVYGNDGLTASHDVAMAFDYHIERRTVMILPIVDLVIGAGTHTYYQVERFGSFLLLGYAIQGGGNMYLDMVYVGAAQPLSCT